MPKFSLVLNSQFNAQKPLPLDLILRFLLQRCFATALLTQTPPAVPSGVRIAFRVLHLQPAKLVGLGKGRVPLHKGFPQTCWDCKGCTGVGGLG